MTWNSGTEMSVRLVGLARQLRGSGCTLSTLVRKFSWVVIAPLGKPVVPLV